MIKPDMIPDEVWHTAMSTYHKTIKKRPGSAWQEAIAAALNAWPRIKLENLCVWVMDGPDLPYVEETASITLPLPQEAGDE